MEKPLGFKNYGSIPHLSSSKLGPGDHYITEGQERILTQKKRDRHDEVLVFEKYDGSNVGIAKKNSQIFALTRSGYKASTSPYRQHHLFNDWVFKNQSLFSDLLENGQRITGEWLAQAHGLKYCIECDPIVFFDIFDNRERMPYDYLKGITVNYGLETPRLIHRGESKKPEDLIDLLNYKTETFKSEDLPEGMVYRVERKGKVDFLAKWVREDFEPGKYMIDKKENELTWNTLAATTPQD